MSEVINTVLAPTLESRENPAIDAHIETGDIAAASTLPVDQEEDEDDQISSEPRLMIKSIVMENFKSYGGVREIGPFHKNFSAIVGPNGSGKSNTIDGLLFVFGKRAKQIRLNKVSELIHCSSNNQQLPSAKVTVYFHDIIETGNGSEDYDVVPGSDLVVSREAMRNNSSNYVLQGKPSTFGEVTTVLKKRGIDLEHNRFLILQGEVEQISLMKPKGLTPHEDGFLEYLEDIIGTRHFNEPIEEATKTVDALQEIRKQKLDRFRAAQQECERLDGPRKEAVAFVTAEKERLELECLGVHVRWHSARETWNELKAEYDKMQDRAKDHKAKMDVHAKAVKEIEKEHNEVLIQFQEKKELQEKAQEDFQEFERLDVKFEEDTKFLQDQVVTANRHLNEGKSKIDQLSRDVVRLEKLIPAKEKEKQSLTSFAQVQQKNLEKFEGTLASKSAEFRAQKEVKVKELEPLKMKLPLAQAELNTKKVKVDALNSKKQRAIEHLEELEQSLREFAEKKKTTAHDLKQCIKEQTDKHGLVEQAKDRLKEMKGGEIDALHAECSKARTKAEEVKDSIAAEQTRGNLIKRIYGASREGKLTGMRGRLGNLGTIDKKYDVAVSTSCALLDGIVVDTVDDAQKVVEFVREEKLGRVTCIVLEKQNHYMAAATAKVKTPCNAPRMVDLIRPKEEIYRCAFYFALKETLVADNMDDATKISYGSQRRWRVVTLDGSLIDISGTMSGGGKQVASGGMSASICDVTPGEAQRVMRDYEEKKVRFHEARHELEQLETSLLEVQKDLKTIESRRHELEMTSRQLDQQIADFSVRKKDHKVPELSADEKKQLKEIEKELKPMQEKVDSLNGKYEEVQKEVNALTESILNVGGDELRSFKTKLEEANKNVEGTDKQIRKIRMDIENAQKNTVKTHELIAKTEKNKKEHLAALEKLKADHAAIDEKALVVYTNCEEVRATVDKLDAVLNDLKAKRNKVIESASDLKKKEVDLIAHVETRSRELQDWNSQVASCKQKINDLCEEHKALPDVKELNAPGKDNEVPEEPPPNPAAEELWVICMKRVLTPEEIASVNGQVVQNNILALEANLKNMKPNLSLIEEYKKKLADANAKHADFEAAHSEKEDSRKMLEKLRTDRLDSFMDGFSIISLKLKEMYQMITLGGDAELELVDATDPFLEGIGFSVRPPKKSWKQITNLSGGEKTLASLSLVFALHHYRPTPLYFLDEIDAALDFRNVAIIGNYIKRRTRNAQFIIISLRNHMFELADLLVGIYKTDDQSKCVSIDPDKFTGPPQAVDASALRGTKRKRRDASSHPRRGPMPVDEDEPMPVADEMADPMSAKVPGSR